MTPAEDRKLDRRMREFIEELRERDGDEAVATFADVIEYGLAKPQEQWRSYVECHLDALRRGEWRQVRDRLAELGYSRRPRP